MVNRDAELELLRARVAELENKQEELRRQVQRTTAAVPVMMAAVDPQGRYVLWNRLCEQVSGYEASAVVGNPRAGELLYPERGDGFMPFGDDVQLRRHVECRLRRRDGTRRTVVWFGMGRAPEMTGWHSFAVGFDVTESRETEQLYRMLVEALPDGIVVYRDSKIVYVNPAALALLGADSPEQLLGKNPMNFVHPEAEQQILDRQRTLQEGRTGELAVQKLVRLDGQEMLAEAVALPITFEGRASFMVVGRDITARRRAEEQLHHYQRQLRKFASQMFVTEESERKEIARDLHDSVGQYLALSKLKLGLLNETLSDTKARAYLDEAASLIEQAVGYTRTLTFELSPPSLYRIGLLEAIKDLVSQFRRKHPMRFTYEGGKDEPDLKGEQRIVLYRAVRELLLNTIKHSRAQNVRVHTRYRDEHFVVIVEDDGIGFEQSSKPSGFGLFSIRERLDYLGGHMDIVSTPGRGSAISLCMPVDR